MAKAKPLTPPSVLTLHDDGALYDYLAICARFRKFNVEQALIYARSAVRYYKGDAKARDHLVEHMSIEARWYDALDGGKPDYGVYNDDYYISDIWACWCVYSRKYLLELKKPRESLDGVSIIKALGPIRHVADLGCGFGYTTAAIKELFPKAEVCGTNLKGTTQYAVATDIGKQRGFSVVPDIMNLPSGQADLIFASEYFEHIERPVEHLIHVCKTAKPRALIMANAFGARSTGHFNVYKNGDEVIPNKKIGRLFNKTLRELGYTQLKAGLWNNRPAIWVLSKGK